MLPLLLLHTAAATAMLELWPDFCSSSAVALLLLHAFEKRIVKGPVSRLEGPVSRFELHLRQHSAIQQRRAAPACRVGNAIPTALRAAPMTVEQFAQCGHELGAAGPPPGELPHAQTGRMEAIERSKVG